MSKSIIADLQARHDSMLGEKTTAEDAHSRAIDALKQESDSSAKQLVGELQSKYDALVKELSTIEGAHKNELENMQAQRDDLTKQLYELEVSRDALTADHSTAKESHSKALEKQRAEIEQKYASLLDVVQADTDRLEKELATAVSDKRSALNELVTLKKELYVEIDALRGELGSKKESGSTQLSEVTKKYETVLAEKAAAEAEHEAAITLLQEDLKEQHDRALSDLQSKHHMLQQKLAQIDQEHGDALELLKEEFKSGQSRL
jgi:hypothetical protein